VMGLVQIFVTWVRSAIHGLRLELEIHLKIQIFFIFITSGQKNIFGSGQKESKNGRWVSYLLRVKSMLGSGLVRAHLLLTLHHFVSPKSQFVLLGIIWSSFFSRTKILWKVFFWLWKALYIEKNLIFNQS